LLELDEVIGCSTLETHSLGGNLVLNEQTGDAEIGRSLDKAKLDYVHELLCIRVQTVGINEADRSERKVRSYFNKYVKMCAEKHRKRMQRRPNKNPAAGNGSDHDNDAEHNSGHQ
jgi:hypothetical protein